MLVWASFLYGISRRAIPVLHPHHKHLCILDKIVSFLHMLTEMKYQLEHKAKPALILRRTNPCGGIRCREPADSLPCTQDHLPLLRWQVTTTCSSLSTSQKCISVDFPNPRGWSHSAPRKQRLPLTHLYADFIPLALTPLFSHPAKKTSHLHLDFPVATDFRTIPLLRYRPVAPVHLRAQSWLCFGTGQWCAPGKGDGGGVMGKCPQSSNAVILAFTYI